MKEDHLILLDICFPCLRREPFLSLSRRIPMIDCCMPAERASEDLWEDGPCHRRWILRMDLNECLARVSLSHVYY